MSETEWGKFIAIHGIDGTGKLFVSAHSRL